MTVTDAPSVGPVAAEHVAQITGKLNGWRDDMPEVTPGDFSDPDPQAFAVTINGEIAGGYLMVAIPMANEIVALAIDPAHRRRGLGRMCLLDALFRSGKRPLVLTASDSSVGFARAVGFKVIGKRKLADGAVMTRLGWHAPRPLTDPTAPPGC